MVNHWIHVNGKTLRVFGDLHFRKNSHEFLWIWACTSGFLNACMLKGAMAVTLTFFVILAHAGERGLVTSIWHCVGIDPFWNWVFQMLLGDVP